MATPHHLSDVRRGAPSWIWDYLSHSDVTICVLNAIYMLYILHDRRSRVLVGPGKTECDSLFIGHRVKLMADFCQPKTQSPTQWSPFSVRWISATTKKSVQIWKDLIFFTFNFCSVKWQPEWMCMLEIRLIMDEKTNSNDKENKEFIYFTVTSIVTTRPFPSFRRGVPIAVTS